MSIGARAAEVLKRLQELKDVIVDHTFEVADLLIEVRDEQLYLAWGYDRFGTWVNEANLGLKERSAYYLMKIVEGAAQLGIPRDELKKADISKLKEIFTLDVDTKGNEIKQLVGEAVNNVSLEDIRQRVEGVEFNEDREPTTWLNLKLLRATKDNIVLPAFEKCRRIYGDTIDEEGDPVDISDSKALEMICANFLADDTFNEPPVIEGEVVETESVQ